MWNGLQPVGHGFAGGYISSPAVVPQMAQAPHAVHAANHCSGLTMRLTKPQLERTQSPFVFRPMPPGELESSSENCANLLPPPPPAVASPWLSHEKTFDAWNACRGSAQTSILSNGITSEPDGEPMAVGDIERVLAHAMANQNIDRLRRALGEASRSGTHSVTVQHARDMLLGLEAVERREEAGRAVDEAIELDDWWKMQGALQQALAADLPKVKIDGLRDAMQLYQRRKEAAMGLQKAVETGDTEELRIAIEKALTGHVRQRDVDRAREALHELESRKVEAHRLEQARSKFEEQLREAAETKSTAELFSAISQAELGLNPDANALTREVRMRAIGAARAELRTQALNNLRDLHQAGDIPGLNSALKDALRLGVKEAEVEVFSERLQNLRKLHHHRQELRTAVKAGEMKRLLTVVGEAEAAGLGDDDHLKEAKIALEEAQLQERRAEERARALTKAAEDRARAEQQALEERKLASENLRHAYLNDDIEKLSSAICHAAKAGLSGAELAPVEERLRVLRGRAGASAELSAAIEAGNVYKLRAAIASVSGAEVDERLLAQAKESLRKLNLHADIRRKLSSAVSSGQAAIITQALEEARTQGLPRHELAEADAALRSVSQTDVDGELQAAMEAGSISRLRTAIASAAGMFGQRVEAAWEQMRSLENNEWALRELRNAVASGDSVRLQVAISQAEQANLNNDDVVAARTELQTWAAQRHAQQELQLARASGNASTLRSALDIAKAAGVVGDMVQSAENELDALERGSAWRPPPPLMSPPPPPTRDDPGIQCDSDDENNADHDQKEAEAAARTGLPPRTLTNPQVHEFPPRTPTNPQIHELPPRTITDPQDHDVFMTLARGAPLRISWTPQFAPQPQPQADMLAPTDPQFHDFPISSF